MKRTTVFLLALLLAAGCLFTLAGCGQSHFDSKDANLRLFFNESDRGVRRRAKEMNETRKKPPGSRRFFRCGGGAGAFCLFTFSVFPV